MIIGQLFFGLRNGVFVNHYEKYGKKRKKETIVHFIYIRDENALLNAFVDFLKLQKAKIKTDFSFSNVVTLDFQL